MIGVFSRVSFSCVHYTAVHLLLNSTSIAKPQSKSAASLLQRGQAIQTYHSRESQPASLLLSQFFFENIIQSPFPQSRKMAPVLSLPGQAIARAFHWDSATPTVNLPHLVVRQNAPTATVTVVADNNNGNNNSSGLSGGAIAGIVIGSIVGFLLILWVVRSCMNLGAPPNEEREKWYRDAPRRRHHSRHSRSRRRSSSISAPPPVIIRDARSRDGRSRSARRPSSSSYVYTESDRGQGGYYGRY
jgi:hypothetical protein